MCTIPVDAATIAGVQSPFSSAPRSVTPPACSTIHCSIGSEPRSAAKCAGAQPAWEGERERQQQ